MGMTLSKAYETFISAKPEPTFNQLSKATYRNVVRENVRSNRGMTQLYKAAKREDWAPSKKTDHLVEHSTNLSGMFH